MNLARRYLPDLGALQAFECAARHGSFTRAAEELSLTQSAVSRQVKDLERHLNTLLFERVRQRVVLSEDGKRFLPEARKLLQQSETTMLRAMASADARQTLSVATLPTFGSRWLSPRLAHFVSAHPGVVLNIGSRSAPFDFEDEEFDLAIHYGQPVWARANSIYLCGETIIPVASHSLLQASPQPANVMTATLLAEQPLLQLATRPKLWSQWFTMAGVDAPTAFRGHRLDQFSMIIEAAIAGMGYALLPRYLIETELRTGVLQVVVDLPLQTENSYYVVTPETKQTLPLAQQFTDWLLGQVGSSPSVS
ncbi:LysR family transcriptional regulator [Tianweitania sp. BSSL-BM11]|uniref:LysR family transcriptional regulator n=1 Tax=Tianweitania aestuarii TaxID=2814886 RepID=A0ABS5S0Y9_9HYPH|nr:LysR family transcriptional regulator [Tianweitania aestuarii]MBS9722129.1 LysR family transcriptional regulator [Tianweitania aestuarii]